MRATARIDPPSTNPRITAARCSVDKTFIVLCNMLERSSIVKRDNTNSRPELGGVRLPVIRLLFGVPARLCSAFGNVATLFRCELGSPRTSALKPAHAAKGHSGRVFLGALPRTRRAGHDRGRELVGV